MPLPELRCEQEHMPKSIERILFNIQCRLTVNKVEKKAERNRKRGEGKQETERNGLGRQISP